MLDEGVRPDPVSEAPGILWSFRFQVLLVPRALEGRSRHLWRWALGLVSDAGSGWYQTGAGLE